MTETTRRYTTDEIRALVPEGAWASVNRWLARGDGIAVYANHDLGSRELGHQKFVSFGGGAAQLETSTPPDRLPDIGQTINWRYWLEGVYRGDGLL